MAIVQNNLVTKGFSGSFAGIVFRQLRGKTIVANKPEKVTKQSTLQRENRTRFKAASAWAKAQMLDADKKAYYWRKAQKLKLPNAYTAAVSDYMRKGEIRDIDTRQYKGNASDVVKLNLFKKDFAIHKVAVSLYAADGKLIETAMAVRKDHNIFHYKTTETVVDTGPVTIRVELCDHSRNLVRREVVV